MRARPAAAGLVAAALIMSGCGGGDSSGGGSSKSTPDPDAARAAVAEFTKAFGAGDGARSCNLLTPAARAAFVKRVQKLAATTDCATGIKRLHDDAGPQVASAFSTAKVGGVSVTGTTATAQLTASGHSTTVRLAKQGGSWRLTALPGT